MKISTSFLRKIYLFFIFAIPSFAYCQDTTAIKIVQANLDTIQAYLSKPYPKSFTAAGQAGQFMTMLTGISSTSDGNYAGQDPPNKDDWRKWSIWLHLNKDYITWNKELNKIILHKSIIIPEY